ncbi:hypothetical protein AA313_de0202324 [Arthrobotrys entomopaga]|nr:hypothetical protein AA313_de0202324 [Arthrobotrys entomopaga]
MLEQVEMPKKKRQKKKKSQNIHQSAKDRREITCTGEQARREIIDAQEDAIPSLSRSAVDDATSTFPDHALGLARLRANYLWAYKKHVTAHNPDMVRELWREIIECDLLGGLPKQLRQRLIAPIFWSAVWGDSIDTGVNSTTKNLAPARKKKQQSWDDKIKNDILRQIGPQYFHPTPTPTPTPTAEFQPSMLSEPAFRAKIDPILREAIQCTKSHLLHYAVAISPKAVGLLLNTDIIAELSQKSKQELMLLAAFHGSLETVSRLVESDNSLVNYSGKFDCFDDLIPRNLPFAMKGTQTALHIASYLGNEAIVRFLLENGADINMAVPLKHKPKPRKDGKPISRRRTSGGSTALEVAVYEGRLYVVHTLLEWKPETVEIALSLAKQHHPEKYYHTAIVEALEQFILTNKPQIE